LRILKRLVGVLDGVSLAALRPGFLYEVEDALARYLISSHSAEESRVSNAALVPAIDDPYVAHLTGGVTVSQSDPGLAHDKPIRKRSRKRD